MSARRKLVKQVGFVIVLTALAKIAAFAKDVLLSLQFGAGQQADAYFIANTIPGFVFGGVFATIGMVFLPAFRRAAAESDEKAAITYRTAVTCYTGLSFALGCLTFFGAGWIISTLAPDQPQETRDLAALMTRIMAFGFVFSGWVGLQNTVLQSHKHLIWPQFVPVLNHFFAIGGLALAALTGGTITLLVYAAVLGWIVTAPLVALRARAYWPKARSALFDRRVAWSLLVVSFPVFLSLSLDQASVLIGTALVSSFPEGAVSHMNYASRLTILLSSVFSLVIAYVLFPYLADSIVARRRSEARKYVLQSLIAVMVLSAPLMILGLTMGNALIAFVFQRGAFGYEDALATGKAMAFFAPVIVLSGVREVLNRLFLAQQNTRALLLFGALAVVVNIVASVYFSRLIGFEGIALGNSLGALVYVAAQATMILARQRELAHRDLPIWLALISGAMLIAALVGLWLNPQPNIAIPRLDFLVNAIIVTSVFWVLVGVPVLMSPRLRQAFRKDDPE